MAFKPRSKGPRQADPPPPHHTVMIGGFRVDLCKSSQATEVKIQPGEAISPLPPQTLSALRDFIVHLIREGQTIRGFEIHGHATDEGYDFTDPDKVGGVFVDGKNQANIPSFIDIKAVCDSLARNDKSLGHLQALNEALARRKSGFQATVEEGHDAAKPYLAAVEKILSQSLDASITDSVMKTMTEKLGAIRLRPQDPKKGQFYADAADKVLSDSPWAEDEKLREKIKAALLDKKMVKEYYDELHAAYRGK